MLTASSSQAVMFSSNRASSQSETAPNGTVLCGPRGTRYRHRAGHFLGWRVPACAPPPRCCAGRDFYFVGALGSVRLACPFYPSGLCPLDELPVDCSPGVDGAAPGTPQKARLGCGPGIEQSELVLPQCILVICAPAAAVQRVLRAASGVVFRSRHTIPWSEAGVTAPPIRLGLLSSEHVSETYKFPIRDSRFSASDISSPQAQHARAASVRSREPSQGSSVPASRQRSPCLRLR